MGLISKAVHNRTTNKLVAPTRLIVKADSDTVAARAKSIVDSYTPRQGLLSQGQRLWYFRENPNTVTVLYGPPSKKEPGKVVRSWWLNVTMTRSSEVGATTLVEIVLVKWKTVDGKLQFRSEFEGFRDRLIASLRALDPSAQLLTEPA